MVVNIFDILLLLTVIAFIVLSAKKGFALSLLNTIAFVLSGVISYNFSGKIAEFIFSSFLRDSMEARFNELLSESIDGISLGDLTNAIPEGFVKIWEGLGFNLDSLLEMTMQADYPSEEMLIDKFIDNVASNIVISVVEIIVFIVLFIVLSIVLKFVASLLDKVIKITPIAGKANTVLGGALGLVKGFVLVFVICSVICPIILAIDAPVLKDTISTSVIYEFLRAKNPLIDIM